MSLCPVCGYELDFTPWKGGTQDPERLCHCCGMCFGHDDIFAADRGALYDAARARWIKQGLRWWSTKPEPSDFDPEEQLRRLWLSKWHAKRD